ncbi:MAG: TrkA C-terminal domain-containing protein [Phycisphaerae bacterium]|nr:TrkA C-terminal domain-containing protein [Phycisphaerae bacterium]
MIAAISLLVALSISILINRIATAALTHTGLSRESARFQARSAFSGVGFTTNEAENVVNHPVRRKILMFLMLLGNAGIITVISSMILTFVDPRNSESSLLLRAAVIVAGIAVLWTASYSKWLDQHLSRIIRWALARWTDLDVRDYASLLHLGGDYSVMELLVQPNDWMSGRTLAELGLREEGVLVLGIQPRSDAYVGAPTRNTRIHPGDTMLLYGRDRTLASLDRRKKEIGGQLAHVDAVAEQRRIEEETDRTLEKRERSLGDVGESGGSAVAGDQ